MTLSLAVSVRVPVKTTGTIVCPNQSVGMHILFYVRFKIVIVLVCMAVGDKLWLHHFPKK